MAALVTCLPTPYPTRHENEWHNKKHVESCWSGFYLTAANLPSTISCVLIFAMEVDAEKLLVLIQQRDAIYNYKLKEHSNRTFIDKLWEEISEEIKYPVSECKSKWASLRSSYSRQLRKEQMPSESGAKKKKKWYLTDAMGFLRDYVHQHRTTNRNFDHVGDDDPLEDITSVDMTYSMSQTPSKISRTNPVEPMIEFWQTKTKAKDNEKESSTSLFFKCMQTDFENLSKKKQRQFRKKMSDLMLELQEEEENEDNDSEATTSKSVKRIS